METLLRPGGPPAWLPRRPLIVPESKIDLGRVAAYTTERQPFDHPSTLSSLHWIARAHARRLCHAIPDSDCEAAIRKGWICVPNGTVDALID
jgi:hypothetical protein